MKDKTIKIIISTCMVIVTIIFLMIFLANFDKLFPDLCKFFSNLFESTFSGILFSGFIGSLIAALIVFYQIREGNKSLRFTNQLKLRKMFATPERMKIHYIFKKKIENPRVTEENEKSINAKYLFDTENEFEIHRDDYLGIFEIAYEMLRKKQVDKELFFQSYSYRISKIAEYKPVKNMLNDNRYTLWQPLKDLIHLNDEWRAKHNKEMNHIG